MPKKKWQTSGEHMKAGSLEGLRPGEFGIVLGIELARALGVLQGDKVVLIAPQGQVTPAGIVPRLRQFTVVGIFSVDHFEYDSGLWRSLIWKTRRSSFASRIA